MLKYSNTVVDPAGTALVGALVRVLKDSGLPASIYSDDGVNVASNPLICDGDGYFEFYAEEDVYTLVVTYAGKTAATIRGLNLGVTAVPSSAAAAVAAAHEADDDRIQTGLDRAATGEDRVQTGADRGASDTSAAASAASATASQVARVASEAARDATNSSGKVFTAAEGTAAGITATTNGQNFDVLTADLLFYTRYRNNAGTALPLTSGYTKSYLDSLAQVVTSNYPYLLPFTAKDSAGNDWTLGGFDLNGKFNLGAVKDVGGKVNTITRAVYEVAARSGWLLPFTAIDAAGVERTLGGWDQLGRLISGGKKVVREGDYAFSYIGPTATITSWGDSLTEGSGGTPYPAQLATLLGRAVSNMGYGGQKADQIISRQGGYSALLTVSGNQIPTSGAVAVTMATAILAYPSAQAKSITGSISTFSGPIAGTLTKDVSNNYTFTRTVAGTAAKVLANTPFHADMNGLDYGVNILWVGTNDAGTTSIATVPDFVARFVESIKTVEKRFLILSPLADTSFTSGTAGYINMRAVAETLKLRYPRNFLDVHMRLVNSYDPGIPQDVTDFGNGVHPTSLRADTVHLNTAGYALVAQWVFQFLVAKGWV